MKSQLDKIFLLAFVGLLLTGCTHEGASVKGFGNSILSTFGFSPPKSEFATGERFIDATQQLSREEEYYFGRAVAAKILSLYPMLKDTELTSYINKVGQAVAISSPQPYTFGGYHFLVLDTAEVNALSAPGGFIFISRGLLERIPNEDALAAVLAHEVSHVVRKHGVRSISKENLSDSLKNFGKIAGSLNCNELAAQALTIFSAAVDQAVDNLLTAGYSREFEYEADADAFTILGTSGYDPKALNELLAMLDHMGEGQDKGWYRTHPLPSDREKRLEALLAEGSTEIAEEGKALRRKRFDTEVRIHI